MTSTERGLSRGACPGSNCRTTGEQMNNTEINWTELTWNPASGCTKVSPACEHCYAEKLAEQKRGTRAFPKGFDLMLRPWKLGEPAKVKRPSLIFTNSMTDMFHKDIPDAYRDDIIAAMLAAPRHRYQVLTKRPEIAARYFSTRKVPACMWLGCTVEDQERFDLRVPILRSIDAHVRFLSCEPIRGLIRRDVDLSGIHWLITGGESGNHANNPKDLERCFLVRRGPKGGLPWLPREDRMSWVRNLRDACIDQGVRHWFKQWGGATPKGGGRTLDRRTWDELPEHIPGAMPDNYVHRAPKVQLPLAV